MAPTFSLVTQPPSMSDSDRFVPKVAVKLDPPRNDPFTKEQLSQFDGKYIWFASQGVLKPPPGGSTIPIDLFACVDKN